MIDGGGRWGRRRKRGRKRGRGGRREDDGRGTRRWWMRLRRWRDEVDCGNGVVGLTRRER